MHFQLSELQLEEFGKILMKIYLGQNTLMNILLKMKTNLDFNPENLMENLKSMQRNGKDKRRSSATQIVDMSGT